MDILSSLDPQWSMGSKPHGLEFSAGHPELEESLGTCYFSNLFPIYFYNQTNSLYLQCLSKRHPNGRAPGACTSPPGAQGEEEAHPGGVAREIHSIGGDAWEEAPWWDDVGSWNNLIERCSPIEKPYVKRGGAVQV